MMLRWLPDPEHYAHPRLSWLLQYIFGIVLRRMFRIEHDLPRGFRPPPGALIVSNHMRDSDAPLIGTLLCQREGVHMRGELPFFVMREDLFQRGALANLLYKFPPPAIRVLRLVSLMWLFGNVRTLPMRRLREFTWHDTLREVLRVGMGPRDPATVFNARGLRELRACIGAVPARVDAINPWHMGATRVAHWGLRRLTLPALHELAPDFRAAIQRQLKDIAAQLDAGHRVFFAPEGGVSMDGRFCRIRAGTWRLGRMTAALVACVPVTLSYDPLRPGRARGIVRVGKTLDRLDVNDPRVVTNQLRQTLNARRVITPSHLLAQFLVTRRQPFAADDLVHWMERALALAKNEPALLDTEFEHVALPALVAARLQWLRRKHLVRWEQERWHNHWPRDTPPGWGTPAAVVRYLANALGDFAPRLVLALST